MSFAPDTTVATRVNTRAQSWRQGDVVEAGPIIWLTTTDAPLTPQGAQVGGDGVVCVVAEAERLVVVSQTCDVVRDCAQRPYVLLARVVSLDEPEAGEARRGSRPRFVPVPGLGDDAFADLDLLTTVEKSVIVDQEPISGLPDDDARRSFGLGVARTFSQFAFPDDLKMALHGLVARIRTKHAKNSPEGRALAALDEIRVAARPSWDAPEIDVFLYFTPGSRRKADEVMSDDEWADMVDGWLLRASPFGVIRSIDGDMVPLDELSAREYLDSDALDLDHLSRPATAQAG